MTGVFNGITIPCQIAEQELCSIGSKAQELYKTFGFSEVGRRKNYYLEPLEDALVMKKIINE